jgi:type II secretory ATPase GspE/PulE/Tfp pilus assembly ATPase PilB-like protein
LKNVPLNILQESFGNDFSLENIHEGLFFEGSGCSHCKNTGYSGRVAIVEIIDVNENIKDFIMDASKILKEEDVRENQDFTTMKEDGIIKSLKGLTTVQEVLRVIQD